MSETHHRRQYLMGIGAGYTCLVLSLIFYGAEGGMLKSGWISDRTVNSFAFLYAAILFLFPASLSYSKMLLAQRAEATPQPPAFPVRARRLVTWTVLLTLAAGSLIEVTTLGTDPLWRVLAPTAR